MNALTQEEKDVILKIANRVGCDRDGDILTFYVQEDKNIVAPLHLVPTTKK